MTDEQVYFLQTERIGFRHWAAFDFPLAVAIWGNPQVTRLIADLGNPSEEQAQARLSHELANQEAFGVQYWPIFVRESGENLGCCGLRPYRPAEGIFEVGSHILPKYWRQGYATEAVGCVVEHAFEHFAAVQITARIHPDNAASLALARRLGFSCVGIVREPRARRHHC